MIASLARVVKLVLEDLLKLVLLEPTLWLVSLRVQHVLLAITVQLDPVHTRLVHLALLRLDLLELQQIVIIVPQAAIVAEDR